MAHEVLSFLKSCDWKGKNVISFQIHGGWPRHVIKDIKSACKGAEFIHEMEIQFDSTGGVELVTKKRKLKRESKKNNKERFDMKAEELSVFPVGGKMRRL